MTARPMAAAPLSTTDFDAAGMRARISETRAARKLSLEEVAKASGFTKSHVWELEQGRSRNPTVRAVWGLSRALGVSPAWLLGLDTEAVPVDPLAFEIAALIDQRLTARGCPRNEPVDCRLADARQEIVGLRKALARAEIKLPALDEVAP